MQIQFDSQAVNELLLVAVVVVVVVVVNVSRFLCNILFNYN